MLRCSGVATIGWKTEAAFDRGSRCSNTRCPLDRKTIPLRAVWAAWKKYWAPKNKNRRTYECKRRSILQFVKLYPYGRTFRSKRSVRSYLPEDLPTRRIILLGNRKQSLTDFELRKRPLQASPPCLSHRNISRHKSENSGAQSNNISAPHFLPPPWKIPPTCSSFLSALFPSIFSSSGI